MGNNWNENATVAICLLVYGVIISTCGILITIRLIHQLTTRKTKTVKSIKILTIAATIIASIGICCATLSIVTFYIARIIFSNYYQFIMRLCYFLSLLSIITVAAIRLHVTLNSTSYQYSPIVYIIFWITYIVLTIMGIIASVGQLFLGDTIPFTLVPVASIIYVCLTSYIIVLFVKILKNIGNKLDGKEQTKHKAQLFRVMTKYTLLVMNPSLVSLVTGIIALEYAFASKITIFRRTIYLIVLTADFLINIIFLSLQFEFNESVYFKYCSKCHDCSVDIVLKASTNNTNRDDDFAIKRMVSSPPREMEERTVEAVNQ